MSGVVRSSPSRRVSGSSGVAPREVDFNLSSLRDEGFFVVLRLAMSGVTPGGVVDMPGGTLADTYPTLEEARGLAARGNLIPLYREVLADMETPVSVYRKIAKGPY